MRQRKAKNLEERLERLEHYLVEQPAKQKGSWRQLFSDRAAELAAAATGNRGSASEGNGHPKLFSGETGGSGDLYSGASADADRYGSDRDGAALRDSMTDENSGFVGSGDGERNAVPLFLEIGCGKGQFILAHAKAEPDSRYIAVEGQNSVILRALEKAEAAGVNNVLFICDFVRDIRDWFLPGELDGIYLNFSDPWPKARHAKRRLTHGDYLLRYKSLLKEDGFIEIKTDNDDLFAFTIEEIRRVGLEIREHSDDLHNSFYESREFMTEYEEKFHQTGKNIHYVKIG